MAQSNPTHQNVRDVIPNVIRPNPYFPVSHNLWNLYFTDDGLVAVQMYKGWLTIIGFLVGLPLAIWPFLITTAIGMKLDEVRGRKLCEEYADQLDEILSDPENYTIETSSYAETVIFGERETVFLNFLERFKIKVGSREYFVTRSRLDSVADVIPQYFSSLTFKREDKHE